MESMEPVLTDEEQEIVMRMRRHFTHREASERVDAVFEQGGQRDGS